MSTALTALTDEELVRLELLCRDALGFVVSPETSGELALALWELRMRRAADGAQTCICEGRALVELADTRSALEDLRDLAAAFLERLERRASG